MQPDPLASYNERVKLVAAFYNAIGLGMIAVGVLRPLSEGTAISGLAISIWIAGGLAFHALALYILRYMKKGVTP
ncbi:hypothetical protein [Falsirhodobacter sp. 20TX0035]|uniref:hypothetical protein n=1 Tax=Falsirhodobacter sp. 20TX0035 TaxID=3022019 RepID=UPI00232B6869|nr:hypothetical protein [Falsirhodobacter sp. 20TX0035]MDB6453486.1 hypothetical protein [Falsirhodobacter sp. 20TX0035]